MNDYEALQTAITAHAHARQEEQRSCETFLNALYQAFRATKDRGQPYNNIKFDLVRDPRNWVRPAPLGSWHAAWFRVGVCEVMVSVRREGEGFCGEYGRGGFFVVASPSTDALLDLAQQIMHHLTALYEGPTRPVTLN